MCHSGGRGLGEVKHLSDEILASVAQQGTPTPEWIRNGSSPLSTWFQMFISSFIFGLFSFILQFLVRTYF